VTQYVDAFQENEYQYIDPMLRRADLPEEEQLDFSGGACGKDVNT